MIKKILVLPFIILFLFSGSVNAESNDLPDPGLTPENPLYFFDTLGESVSLFFAFGKETKAIRAAEIADEKVSEIQAMIRAGRPEFAEQAANRYGGLVDIATDDLEEWSAKDDELGAGNSTPEIIAQKVSNQLGVLSGIYTQIPNSEKSILQHAIDKSENGIENALNILSSDPKKEQTRMEIQNRLNQYKRQRMMLNVQENENQDKIQKGMPGNEGSIYDQMQQMENEQIRNQNKLNEINTPMRRESSKGMNQNQNNNSMGGQGKNK